MNQATPSNPPSARTTEEIVASFRDSDGMTLRFEADSRGGCRISILVGGRDARRMSADLGIDQMARLRAAIERAEALLEAK